MNASTRDAATNADRRRVQREAIRAGIWVALASAAVLAILTAVTVFALFVTSRPDPDSGRPGGDDVDQRARVTDLDDAIPIVVLAGAGGVIALGFVGWYASRRAAQPLAEALRVQRAFVADASHELRTPLTTISSRIQLAQHRARQGGDVDAVLSDLRTDADVMDAVLTDLLTSAASAGTAPTDRSARADALSVAHDAVALFRPRAQERDVALVVKGSGPLDVSAERAAVLRAVTALLDNALRYAPAQSVVTVELNGNARWVEIRVSDEGEGITGIDPERVFDRFARADSRPPQAGMPGHGLGLALVRDIAARFHGSVTVEQTSPAGTTILLALPAARDHTPRP